MVEKYNIPIVVACFSCKSECADNHSCCLEVNNTSLEQAENNLIQYFGYNQRWKQSPWRIFVRVVSTQLEIISLFSHQLLTCFPYFRNIRSLALHGNFRIYGTCYKRIAYKFNNFTLFFYRSYSRYYYTSLRLLPDYTLPDSWSVYFEARCIS